MAEAKKQDRWLDVKDAMPTSALVLGEQTVRAITENTESLILRLSFYKMAAKLIGPDKRVLVYDCGDGIGAWVIAKECGYALGLSREEASLKNAVANFVDPRISFQRQLDEPPAGPWNGAVRFLNDAADLNAFIDDAAPRLADHGVLALGMSPTAQATDLRGAAARRFHHVFTFRETLGIVPTADGDASHLVVAVGCRPRR